MINKNKYKKISILGGGESGVGAALLCHVAGIECFLSDAGSIAPDLKDELIQNKIPFEENTHSEELIAQSDAVVKSPGIPPTAAIIKNLKSRSLPIFSEIEFASQFTNAKLIAITGSNGKTTTTALVHHILAKSGLDVAIAGNIGESFARKLAQKDYDYFVLEVSSFQLEDVNEFKPHIALLLNITPDHLDRYNNSLENYARAKFRIIENQTKEDYFIFNADDTMIKKLMNELPALADQTPISMQAAQSKGAHYENNSLMFNYPLPWQMPQSELALKGKHNISNSLAAGLAANLLKIKNEKIRESLRDFVGLPHRLEKVLSIRGVEYINDSKATNVNSTYFALESMTTPTVWIAGGTDKGNDYSALTELAKSRVKALICLGLDNSKLINQFGNIVPQLVEADSMKEAVQTAFHLARKGDSVLLSPACASFDLFENYEHRGNEFKKEVRGL